MKPRRTYFIARAEAADGAEILALYREVAAVEGGLARTASEIDAAYIDGLLNKSLKNGIILVARHPGSTRIIGEIHTYGPGLTVFSHVFGDLTVAVHPEFQGAGVGRALFTELLAQVRANRPDILRVELISRESNRKAIQLYQKMGFRIEGRLAGRIRSVGGGLEADIPMAWHRGPGDSVS